MYRGARKEEQHTRFGENASYRHGRGRILGTFRRALSRSASSSLLKVTDSGVPALADIENTESVEPKEQFRTAVGVRAAAGGERK
jgi:hypothetical protein